MRKKVLIGTIFPLTAMLAVIGSGFSLWVFSDSNHVELDTKVGIKTTDVLTSGNILVYNDCYWPDYKGTGNDRSYQNYSYIEFDQVLDESQDYNLLKHPSSDKRTSAYYLWSNNNSITNSINNDNGGYTRNYTIDTKTGIPFENLGKDGGTDIIFTTTLIIPNELSRYISLSYNTHSKDTLQVQGFNKIIGTQNDNEETDHSTTYVITERYSDLDPNGTYAKEIYSESLEGYKNHENNKKYGFKFFDWGNMTITYFNADKFKEEAKDKMEEWQIENIIKNFHKSQPTTLSEYEEMLNELSKYDGKSSSEQFNHKIAIGVTYKAEICFYDSERANSSN